jgi:hypothetical protein
LGFGVEAEDLAGLGGGDFRLAQQESEVESLLSESGVVGVFFEGGVQKGAGFLETAGFEKFVGPSRLGVARARTTRKDDNGQQAKESPEHDSQIRIRIRIKEGWKVGRLGEPSVPKNPSMKAKGQRGRG